MDSKTPLVSVIIPVFNGEEFLREAIDSVLAQTWANWDLTIGNNRSTDRTLAIAEEYAESDPRVRVVTYDEHVSVVDSHNNAFRLASPDAKYIKILGADDWFFPHCVEEMVRLAEAHPTVAMVSSYVLAGRRVAWDGLPYPSTFITGRDVCRLRLLESIRVFGGPSSSLLRADVVRARDPFYNPLNYHGDTEAYLELLQEHDFAFVHQVLSYLRKGEDSRTTAYLERVDSYPAADVDEVSKWGPVYLTAEECRARLNEVWRSYYAFLGRAVFEARGKEFWDYHLVHFRKMGYPVSRGRIALNAAYRLADIVFNPLRTLRGIARRLRERSSDRRSTQPGRSSAVVSKSGMR